MLKKIQNFYLNNQKTYKLREVVINWFLTIALVGVVVFLTLSVLYFRDFTNEYYVKTTLPNGTVVEQTSLDGLANFVLFFTLTTFFFVMSPLVLLDKVDLRIDRKTLEAKEKLRDQYSKAKINRMNNKELLVLVKKLGSNKIVFLSRKQQAETEKLPSEALKAKVLRALYPCTTKIVVNQTQDRGCGKPKTKPNRKDNNKDEKQIKPQR